MSKKHGREEPTVPCLHCHNTGGGLQVSCDECGGHICTNCHWCHEFQANHEIRVCDRCDGFYCRQCDEMDQCDDCGEVVCGGCSSLLSCKFCGGGLCPDCATACGKCGIVLCARDSKFAVECDTCKLSYCLVCLASSNKDPCVRCGHRPSKRMEQLVHLRLKSIYKAFQQSSPSKKQTKFAAAAVAACGREAAVVAAAAAATTTTTITTTTTTPKKGPFHEKTFSARQAQADAAAAALLAELDEEEEDKKKKTSKKKKKKAKSKEKDEVTLSSVMEDEEPPQAEEMEDEEEGVEEQEKETPHSDSSPPPEEKMDPDEARFCEMVVDNDAEGIEALLAELKGVPGKAALRKNAKKALKRFREKEQENLIALEEEEERVVTPPPSSSYKPPEPLLSLVSRNIHSNSKSECVLHMSPSVVGWVIGKGGQRIRDLMDESGSKVWIDQDSMGQQDPRVVYVSGPGKSVEDAVWRLKDLVAKAPVGASSMTVTSQSEVPPKLSSPGLARSVSLGPKKAPPYAASSPAKDWTVQDVTCEARFVPLLIGRRGWTIKHIQDSSGARVDIDQSVTPRRIRISGKKDCVATAVRMVKDVLSYPHAQLESRSEDIVSFDVADGTHSPPPSSLIMTDDIKGIISATSSLSSTPDPSMASLGSSYKHPGPAGAVIPPDVSAPMLQTAFGESNLEEFAHPTEPPLSGISNAALLFPMANDAPPQAKEANFASLLMTPYEQANQDISLARVSGMPFGKQQQQQHANPTLFGGASAFEQAQQNAPYGLQQQQQLIGQPPPVLRDVLGTSDGMRHEPIGQPMPQSCPQYSADSYHPYSADSYQPAHLLFQRSVSENDRGRMPIGNFNDVEPLLPDLWGKDNQASAHNNLDHSPPYLYQGQRLPHRQNSDSAIPPQFYSDSRLARRNSMPESFMHESSVPAAHPPGLAGACKESDYVNSMFGPEGGGDQNLLSGIQGLSLNNDALGWRSSIAGWGNDSGKKDQAQRSEQSGALPTRLLDSSQQQQQQQQSRFAWG